MRELRWMILALLLGWGLGMAVGLAAQDCARGQGGGAPLLAMGPGGDGPPEQAGGGSDSGMEAQGPGRPMGAGRGPGHGGMLAGLDLTQAQKDQLKQLRRARRGKMQAASNALADAREDLRGLMGAAAKGDDYDQKLRAKHEEVLKREAQLGRERFESILELRDLLTDAQRQKLKERMHQAFDGKGRRGVRGGPAGGSMQARPDNSGPGDGGRD